MESLKRARNVVVVPESMAAADLSPSAKYAARTMVTPGDAVPYTIKLVNAGLLAATADITDPLPLELNYVSGSASAGGVYDAGTRTLSWQHVNVPAFGRVGLTFVATATTNIVSPTSVVNTATIAAGQQLFDRQATIVVVPHPEVPPHPLLAGSHKKASERWITPADTLTYTVKLINSGAVDALVDITDPVPPALSYVAGSANHSGIYAIGTQIISWRPLPCPPGAACHWSCRDGNQRRNPSGTGDEHSHDQRNRRWHVQTPGAGDVAARVQRRSHPPVVHSLTIDDQDVLTSPTTTLHIGDRQHQRQSDVHSGMAGDFGAVPALGCDPIQRLECPTRPTIPER
jgi:uncharacterized repeat protein (TIGR01451 family)